MQEFEPSRLLKMRNPAQVIFPQSPKTDETTKPSIEVAAILSAVIVLVVCLFACRFICPNGPEFTALDLDEIRLERLQTIEDRIKQNIKDLKSKLSFHKKKRYTVERERDLKLRLQSFVAGEEEEKDDEEERGGGERDRLLLRGLHDQRPADRTNMLEQANLFNSPPRHNFSSPPLRKNKTMTSPPPSTLIREKEEEKEEEITAEEKEDMWGLWNKVASHKIASKKSNNEEEKEDPLNRKKSYQSIKYGNKADGKAFASSVISHSQREEKDDNYNNNNSKLASNGNGNVMAVGLGRNGEKDYSINVAVKDYRSSEKYTVDVSSNPLLLQQQTAPPAEKGGGTMIPVLKIAAAKKEPSSSIAPAAPSSVPPPTNYSAVKPPPPKGPPPPHVLLKKKLEKLQASKEEERGKDD